MFKLKISKPKYRDTVTESIYGQGHVPARKEIRRELIDSSRYPGEKLRALRKERGVGRPPKYEESSYGRDGPHLDMRKQHPA